MNIVIWIFEKDAFQSMYFYDCWCEHDKSLMK